MGTTKTIVFLIDGLADEPMPELGGKTPLEYVAKPCIDRIAATGTSGSLLTLPAGFPTSSDAANLSVLGYDLATCYTGRGALEALSQGMILAPTDVAFRCNLITADGDTLVDYSGGHPSLEAGAQLFRDLAAKFNTPQATFHAGVSYRGLLILHGAQFTDHVDYEKPDDHPGGHMPKLLPSAAPGVAGSEATAALLRDLMARTRPFLEAHPYNQGRAEKANAIWPWSPGKRPAMPSLLEKYGVRGAMISAVDVIFGIGAAAGMTLIHVPGATGWIDTNYEGKADAAVKALETHDFVYLHLEAGDECGHLGQAELKLKVIHDIETRVVQRVMTALAGQPVSYAVLPDHPVPLALRKHTRTPVPVAMCGPHLRPDGLTSYGETVSPTGRLGAMKGDEFMRNLLNLQ